MGNNHQAIDVAVMNDEEKANRDQNCMRQQLG